MEAQAPRYICTRAYLYSAKNWRYNGKEKAVQFFISLVDGTFHSTLVM